MPLTWDHRRKELDMYGCYAVALRDHPTDRRARLKKFVALMKEHRCVPKPQSG